MNGGNGAVSLKELEAVFEGCGYTFRHYPKGKVEFLAWQAGRSVLVETEVDGCCYLLERFELVCYAGTSEKLIDKILKL